jgi:pyruvate/2-oxoglutarate/acetoin dehydrogenase E1 component
MQYYLLVQMTVRDALNSALDEEMSADPSVFMMGEEVSPGINLFCTSSFFLPSGLFC